MLPVPHRLISLAYSSNGKQLLQYIQAPLNPSGPKKQHMVFPMLNMNPVMLTCPGEPGLLFASRHEILYNALWSLFCQSMEGKKARWCYLGEYNSVLHGKMTAEQFRVQKQAVMSSMLYQWVSSHRDSHPILQVKDKWGKLILNSKWHNVYMAMLTQMALRKYGLLPSVNKENANALEIMEMAAIRGKTGHHVTIQDITDTFSHGYEVCMIPLHWK